MLFNITYTGMTFDFKTLLTIIIYIGLYVGFVVAYKVKPNDDISSGLAYIILLILGICLVYFLTNF